jgi:hypothetical protein
MADIHAYFNGTMADNHIYIYFTSLAISIKQPNHFIYIMHVIYLSIP